MLPVITILVIFLSLSPFLSLSLSLSLQTNRKYYFRNIFFHCLSAFKMDVAGSLESFSCAKPRIVVTLCTNVCVSRKHKATSENCSNIALYSVWENSVLF